MKTIKLSTEENAIVSQVEFYITKNVMIKCLADLAYHGHITYPMTKKQIIKELKGQFKCKGVSVYPDYYEDTDTTEEWNEHIKVAEKVVTKLFSELL